MKAAKVYSGGKVHVCATQCETCIFRPGNLMQLQRGRVAGMVSESKAKEAAITCHETINYSSTDTSTQQAICRGYWDRYKNDVVTLRLAQVCDVVEEVQVPKQQGESNAS